MSIILYSTKQGNSLLTSKANIDYTFDFCLVGDDNKCLKEMADGKFSEEDVLGAKKARIHQVILREDSPWSIINIQIANDLDDLVSGNKLIKEYKTVTKKEVVNLAKKIKTNLVYLLCQEGSNGTN